MMKHRSFGQLKTSKRLSIFLCVLAAAWLVAGIGGAIGQNAALAGIGFGLALFFAVGSWLDSPTSIRRGRHYDRQVQRLNSWFRRIGMDWATRPDQHRDSAD
jgi:hypothetical protein